MPEGLHRIAVGLLVASCLIGGTGPSLSSGREAVGMLLWPLAWCPAGPTW